MSAPLLDTVRGLLERTYLLETGLAELIGSTARTPIAEGIQRTVEHFRALRDRGELHARDLEA